MADLMKGKRGLVMGVANERSIAWGIANALAAEGAELAFSYQGAAFGKRVEPLAASVGSDFLVDVDVTNDDSLNGCFDQLKDRWGTMDFLIHAIAFSDKNELTGRFINTTRGNFTNSLAISCFSFIDVARRASEMMPNGGCLITLTYGGSNRVTPNYNVMGVAKAALESATRYLANDLGPQQIRVNAISPGPMKTLAGAAIGGARATFRHTEANAPMRSNATLEAIGGTAVYLCSDYGKCTSGEIVHVDGTVLGRHEGIINFTVGQRKGIGIGGRSEQDDPLYVVRLEAATHRVIVGPRSALAQKTVRLRDMNWLADESLAPREVMVKLRSAQSPVAATLTRAPDSRGELVLHDAQFGVAPGQAAVIYDGNRLLGGGWIVKD